MRATYHLEGDVRKVVRGAFPTAQWIEAALGGSTGLPDCFINDIDGAVSRVAFFELKLGVMKGAMLTYKLRATQKKRIKKMRDSGYRVWLLVGEEGSDRLWRIWPSDGALLGKMLVDGPGAVPILDVRAELLAGSF